MTARWRSRRARRSGADRGQGRVAGAGLGPGRRKADLDHGLSRQLQRPGADVEYNLVDILNITRDGSGRHFKTFSQELRLQGEAFDDKLDWLVGGYYSHEKLRVGSTLKFGAEYGPFASCLIVNGISRALVDANRAGCLTPTGRAVLGGAASPTVRALDLLYSITNMGDDGTVYRQTSKSAALFTHNIIHLTPTIDLTLGARYTREDKDFSADFNNTNTVCPQVRAIPGVSPGIVTLACQGNSTSELNAWTWPTAARTARSPARPCCRGSPPRRGWSTAAIPRATRPAASTSTARRWARPPA
jgi:outer membrane receptor protein involved in Fe transport